MAVESKIDRVDEFVRSIAKLAKREVLIGIPAESSSRNDGGPSNALLGYINEYGSPAQNIPARPFLRPGIKDALPKIEPILRSTAEKALSNPDVVDQGLTKVGLIAQSSVQNRITSGDGFAPLKPATVAARKRKGFMGTKPLVVTGQLLRSISFVIRDKS